MSSKPGLKVGIPNEDLRITFGDFSRSDFVRPVMAHLDMLLQDIQTEVFRQVSANDVVDKINEVKGAERLLGKFINLIDKTRA